MAWRLHLTNQTIHRLHILAGKPPLMAAWIGQRVYYFDFDSGTPMGERAFKEVATASRSDDEWQELMAALTAHNKAVLPGIRAAKTEVSTSDDGCMRLYDLGHADVYLEIDGKEGKLDNGGAADFLAVG
ncbi:MAG: hypothetical protein K8I30_12325, partial [Anaerolineae bacterium]|nr:hypothetical protein [Anaerolineae bacterium]